MHSDPRVLDFAHWRDIVMAKRAAAAEAAALRQEREHIARLLAEDSVL